MHLQVKKLAHQCCKRSFLPPGTKARKEQRPAYGLAACSSRDDRVERKMPVCLHSALHYPTQGLPGTAADW